MSLVHFHRQNWQANTTEIDDCPWWNPLKIYRERISSLLLNLHDFRYVSVFSHTEKSQFLMTPAELRIDWSRIRVWRVVSRELDCSSGCNQPLTVAVGVTGLWLSSFSEGIWNVSRGMWNRPQMSQPAHCKHLLGEQSVPWLVGFLCTLLCPPFLSIFTWKWVTDLPWADAGDTFCICSLGPFHICFRLLCGIVLWGAGRLCLFNFK